jgi:hypothetical protein
MAAFFNAGKIGYTPEEGFFPNIYSGIVVK